MAGFKGFSPDQVSEYLKEQVPTVSGDILDNIIDQKIDGEVLLALDDASMKEIAPLLGDRVKIKRVIKCVLSKTPSYSIPSKVSLFVCI